HGRDAAHAVTGRGGGALLDVELGDGDLPGQLLGDLIQGGRDLLTGTAPLGPEVHEHRLIGLQHVLLEAVVGDRNGAHLEAPYPPGLKRGRAFLDPAFRGRAERYQPSRPRSARVWASRFSGIGISFGPSVQTRAASMRLPGKTSASTAA